MRESDKQMLADHYLDLYRMAFDLLHNEADTEDVVQEALAITMSRAFVSNPYRYCVRTLYNHCYHLLDNHLCVLSDTLPEAQEANDGPDERRIQLVRRLKEELPERAVKIIDLHFSDGYTLDQIAEMQGVSRSAIQKVLHRGEQHLRQQIIELELKEVFES